MLFSIGIELPKNDEQAFGIVVPALCEQGYGCFSAADTEEEIPAMVTEAITLILESIIDDGKSLLDIKDRGFIYYQKQHDYQFCNAWLKLDIDLTAFEGRPKRINISLSDILISRIDQYVKASPQYRDRSHFLAQAARHEMS